MKKWPRGLRAVFWPFCINPGTSSWAQSSTPSPCSSIALLSPVPMAGRPASSRGCHLIDGGHQQGSGALPGVSRFPCRLRGCVERRVDDLARRIQAAEIVRELPLERSEILADVDHRLPPPVETQRNNRSSDRLVHRLRLQDRKDGLNACGSSESGPGQTGPRGDPSSLSPIAVSSIGCQSSRGWLARVGR